ncbi:rhodanese-like domain-containing protein [Shewanella maritima]|uniref:rhodanese-like domain-containing protein n=1 Tax=Shewanella maritima TaxID=2520507 RepID=UPI003734F8D1
MLSVKQLRLKLSLIVVFGLLFFAISNFSNATADNSSAPISPSKGTAQKDPQVAWQKINQGAQIIDVRTQQEFDAGHLPGAINIPFERIVTELAKLNIDKGQNIVLYCRSGRRSGIAHEELVKAGYTDTYNGGGLQYLSVTKPK